MNAYLLIRRIALLLICVKLTSVAGLAQSGLSPDEEGWTIFVPSADSRIIYVDSANGSDAQAVTYSPASSEIGTNPFEPNGPIKPFQTIAAARAHLRADFPDWLLLRRGGIWNEGLGTPSSGRSSSERKLIAWYGGEGAMPLIRTGSTKIMQANFGLSFVAFVGLDFHAHTRDPANTVDYQGPAGEDGFFVYNPSTASQSILWEGCRVRSYENGFNLQSTGADPSDIVIRRCVVLDSYNEGGHSQGLFTAHYKLRLEESIFDHNGWLVKGTGNNSKTGGAATVFNHNTYCSSPKEHIFRGNIFLRPSSIGNKWRSDSPGSGSDIVVDDNFYAEGELGVSLGDNTDEPARFLRSVVTNNVFMHIGRTKPTGRAGLAWYLEFIDQSDGLVADNMFLHQKDSTFSNAFGINLKNSQRNVQILGNIVYNINSESLIVSEDVTAVKENLVIDGNEWQQPGFSARLVEIANGLGGSTGTDT